MRIDFRQHMSRSAASDPLYCSHADASIYLDHAATTPVRPEVIEVMSPYVGTTCGNASSTHRRGRETRAGTFAMTAPA